MPPRRRIEARRRWGRRAPGMPALINDRGRIDVARAMVKGRDNATEVHTHMDPAIRPCLGCLHTGRDGGKDHGNNDIACSFHTNLLRRDQE